MPLRGRLVEPRAASVMRSTAIGREDQHPPSAPPRESCHPRHHRCRVHRLTAPTERSIGLVDVHEHRRSGSFRLGHLRTLERLVLWSTPSTRCPSTGTGRRRIRRLHERILSLIRKNNATNDFQREIGIFNSLSDSGTDATNIGRSGRLSGGPETYLPMIVGWCWKCMVG